VRLLLGLIREPTKRHIPFEHSDCMFPGPSCSQVCKLFFHHRVFQRDLLSRGALHDLCAVLKAIDADMHHLLSTPILAGFHRQGGWRLTAQAQASGLAHAHFGKVFG